MEAGEAQTGSCMLLLQKRQSKLITPCMITKVFRSLFPELPVEFSSIYSLDESVSRLQARCVGHSTHALSKQLVVGSVNLDRVLLERSIPVVENPFKPRFVGTFKQKDRKVQLVGLFGVKKWISFYNFSVVLFFTFITLLSIIAAVANPTKSWFAPLICLSLCIMHIACIKFFQWLSRSDVSWLSLAITETLS